MKKLFNWSLGNYPNGKMGRFVCVTNQPENNQPTQQESAEDITQKINKALKARWVLGQMS